MEAITDLWAVMKKYDPQIYGFEWADQGGPRWDIAGTLRLGRMANLPLDPAT